MTATTPASAGVVVVDLYARISDDQTGQAVGTGNQIDALERYVTQRGWTLGDTYRDDSVSATSGKRRPGFEALLAREVKRPVAVYALDRLARLARDLERVLDVGFPVYSIQGGDLDLSTPDGRAFARVTTSFATAEVEKKSARARLANAAAAAKGQAYWKRRPFGNNVDGSLREDEADAIRWAAAQLLEGATLASVVKEWNRRGLTTPLSKAGGVGGSEWNTANLRAVLRAERLAGLRTYQGTTVPGSWTPVLDEQTWRAMVGNMNARPRHHEPYRGGPTPQNLLTRFLRCPKCGKTVERAGKNYRCPAGGFSINVVLAETLVLGPTWRVLLVPDAVETLGARSGPEADALRIEAGNLRGKLSEWEGAAESLGVAEYLRITTPLRARLSAVETELTAESVTGIFDGLRAAWEDAEAISEAWRALPMDRRRAILSALWSEFVIDHLPEGKGAQIVKATPTPATQALLDATPADAKPIGPLSRGYREVPHLYEHLPMEVRIE